MKSILFSMMLVCSISSFAQEENFTFEGKGRDKTECENSVIEFMTGKHPQYAGAKVEGNDVKKDGESIGEYAIRSVGEAFICKIVLGK